MAAKQANLILAFESSCDETSVAVIKDGHEILANVVATQIKSHQRFGGVVPEVASRHHLEQVIGVCDDALIKANVTPDQLDAVAVTYGPGLVGALLVGVESAKAFAFAHDLPLIGVNHMAGHIYAARFVEPIEFPAMALLVSGGHTELVYMPAPNRYEIIGETRDDAAGEAYDKIGRIMGLPYPAGKAIDELAQTGHDTFHFPRAMEHEDNFDFSFSGLKSAVINTVHHAHQVNELINHADLATSFQNAVVEVLVDKTHKALHQFNVRQLILAGGVAANSQLRRDLTTMLHRDFPELKLTLAPQKLCGDNAAMIGAAAYVQYQAGEFATLALNADPGLEFPWRGEEQE